jgi:hypothetical protein
MSRAALTRINLLLEVGKVRRLRKALQSPSNSEAVRRIIDERLAVEAGLQACRICESSEVHRTSSGALQRSGDDHTLCFPRVQHLHSRVCKVADVARDDC